MAVRFDAGNKDYAQVANSMSGWQCITYTHRVTKQVVGIEVIPENDARPHFSDSPCMCGPRPDITSEVPMLIHNAFDGREKFERLRDQ